LAQLSLCRQQSVQSGMSLRYLCVNGAELLERRLYSAARLPGFASYRGWYDQWRSCTTSPQPLQADKGLRIAKDTNTGKLAGAIFNQVEQEGSSLLIFAGPSASNTALKSLVIARKFFEEKKGQTLEVTPARHSFEREDLRTVEIWLRIRTSSCITLPEKPDIHIEKKSNVGVVAGEVQRAIAKYREVTLSCFGAEAVNTSLKTLITAQNYMVESGTTGKLTFVPAFHTIESKGIRQMWLLCSCK